MTLAYGGMVPAGEDVPYHRASRLSVMPAGLFPLPVRVRQTPTQSNAELTTIIACQIQRRT